MSRPASWRQEQPEQLEDWQGGRGRGRLPPVCGGQGVHATVHCGGAVRTRPALAAPVDGGLGAGGGVAPEGPRARQGVDWLLLGLRGRVGAGQGEPGAGARQGAGRGGLEGGEAIAGVVLVVAGQEGGGDGAEVTLLAGQGGPGAGAVRHEHEKKGQR